MERDNAGFVRAVFPDWSGWRDHPSTIVRSRALRMFVSVLVIFCCGAEHVTIHNDDGAAWASLLTFINARWSDRFGRGGPAVPLSDEERVRLFFHESEDDYILAQADLSEVSEAIDAPS